MTLGVLVFPWWPQSAAPGLLPSITPKMLGCERRCVAVAVHASCSWRTRGCGQPATPRASQKGRDNEMHQYGNWQNEALPRRMLLARIPQFTACDLSTQTRHGQCTGEADAMGASRCAVYGIREANTSSRGGAGGGTPMGVQTTGPSGDRRCAGDGGRGGGQH